MTPQEKAKEYAIEYAENKFPYDIGGDDNWNEKHALVEEVAETACLFMHEWTKQQMIEKACNAYCMDCEYIGCDKFECSALEKFKKMLRNSYDNKRENN